MNIALRPAAVVAVAVSLFATLPHAARAQQPSGLPPEASNPAVKAAAAACQGDIQKHCASVIPGGGRIVRCLAANRADVSEGCRNAILAAKAALGR